MSEFKRSDPNRRQITFDQLIHEQTGLFECGQCKSSNTEWTTMINIKPDQKFFALEINNQSFVFRPESGEIQQGVVDLELVDLNVNNTQIYGSL